MISAEHESLLGSGQAKLLMVVIEASLKDNSLAAPIEQKSILVERLPVVLTLSKTMEGCELGMSVGDSTGEFDGEVLREG